jgi:protein-tyrosine-phosphatase
LTILLEARRLARALRSLSARLRQRQRRRAALQVLAERPPPRSVLFVCHGNICRSPYAAAVFARGLARLALDAVQVDSAGFIGQGRPAPVNAVQVAARSGIDLGVHRAKLVSPSLWARSDLVVVMEPRQRRALQYLFGRDGRPVLVLGDLDPEPAATRAIADPIDQPEAAFEASYRRIDRCIDQLVQAALTSAGGR